MRDMVEPDLQSAVIRLSIERTRCLRDRQKLRRSVGSVDRNMLFVSGEDFVVDIVEEPLWEGLNVSGKMVWLHALRVSILIEVKRVIKRDDIMDKYVMRREGAYAT